MSSFSTEHRRLAAIMFTDMVGYSALSQRNEALALELLEEHRQLLRAVFPKHQGQEIKSTGDGFLVEFASALAAVQCAVEIQKLMRERNASRSAERRIFVRIGIHLGDVVRREGDVFGDGVNIAARIEPLAEPGGVCVSRAVYEQIENKVDHALVQLSKPTLKNIQATVEVYRLVLDEPRLQRSVARKSRGPAMIVGAVALLAVIGVVGFLMSRPPAGTTPNSNPTTNISATNQPSLSAAPAEFRILHSFGPTNVEGINPWGVLTIGSDGFIYGSTVNSGPRGGGSLYRVRTNGADYEVLRHFNPPEDGYGPQGVIETRGGLLYGVTYRGGETDGGVIFRVARDGRSYRVLHHFAKEDDCRNPQYALLEAQDGLLYGTAILGNGPGLAAGGIFRIGKDGSGYTIVARFGNGGPGQPRRSMSGLIQAKDGALYGASQAGGLYDKGAVFRYELSGKLMVIGSIGQATNSIRGPEGNLFQASNGKIYGTCAFGGHSGGGALFWFEPDGSGYQTRWLGISAGEARESHTAVIEAPDGSLLGTSLAGGSMNLGSVFRIGKDGRNYQTLYDFRGAPDSVARARSPLVEGAPGVYYGTGANGGTKIHGVIFQLTIPELAKSIKSSPGR